MYGTCRSTKSLLTVLNVTASIDKQVIDFFSFILIEYNMKFKLSVTRVSYGSVCIGAVKAYL